MLKQFGFYFLYEKSRKKQHTHIIIKIKKIKQSKPRNSTDEILDKIWYNAIKEGGSAQMYTVYDVANWFLQKGGPMNHKKIQKLCYYAQAWSYVFNGAPLIDGNFEAWVHGPVNRSLWNALRDYGYADVSTSEFVGRAHNLDGAADQLLEDIWATYGNFTSGQLESLTHQELPWQKARDGLEPYEASNRVISPADMKYYYQSLIKENGVG